MKWFPRSSWHTGNSLSAFPPSPPLFTNIIRRSIPVVIIQVWPSLQYPPETFNDPCYRGAAEDACYYSKFKLLLACRKILK